MQHIEHVDCLLTYLWEARKVATRALNANICFDLFFSSCNRDIYILIVISLFKGLFKKLSERDGNSILGHYILKTCFFFNYPWEKKFLTEFSR